MPYETLPVQEIYKYINARIAINHLHNNGDNGSCVGEVEPNSLWNHDSGSTTSVALVHNKRPGRVDKIRGTLDGVQVEDVHGDQYKRLWSYTRTNRILYI